MPAPRTAMTPTAETGRPGLYRLLAWLSPAFPIGAFSYSHGLEAAVADGTVRDRKSLEAWVAAIVAHGSGRVDADILRAAYSAAAAGDLAALADANRRGVAYRASAELSLESAQQGAAFLATCRAAWPEPFMSVWKSGSRCKALPLDGGGLGGGDPSDPPELATTSPPPRPSPIKGEGAAAVDDGACHSAAFGAAAARAGIALDDALVGYLQAFAGNLVSAGLRLGVVGQTDGQRILAALEPVVAGAAAAAIGRDPTDFGAATFAADLASMAHETQYTRLFRS